MLSGNTVDISTFGKKKTAVYLIIPDEKSTYHPLITCFIKQAYEVLIEEAQKEDTRTLPTRVNFVLDEFCNMPKIPDMPSMISAARSRNMRYFLVVQSLHQLKGCYGEDADTIKGNCDNWVFLTSKEKDLLQEISDLCGTVTDPGANTKRPLISISELQRLDKQKGEALIMHARQYPIITEIADIDDYPDFKGYPEVKLKEFDLPPDTIFSAKKFFRELKAGKVPVPFLDECGGAEEDDGDDFDTWF
jgi:type IV secretion system protein VirD4